MLYAFFFSLAQRIKDICKKHLILLNNSAKILINKYFKKVKIFLSAQNGISVHNIANHLKVYQNLMI